MSMLSGQIDELRLMGDGQAAKGEFTVATLLREAADTIESLRERLQGGTCTMRFMWHDYEDGEGWECSNCKGTTYTHGWEPSYCERCGAKVVKR